MQNFDQEHDTEIDELNINNMNMIEIIDEICYKKKLFVETTNNKNCAISLFTFLQLLGYTDVMEFLTNNPNACEVVMDHICESNNNNWRLTLLEKLLYLDESGENKNDK